MVQVISKPPWTYSAVWSVTQTMVMSCAYFEPMHHFYSKYVWRAPVIGAVGMIINVFSYDAVLGRDWNLSLSRQRANCYAFSFPCILSWIIFSPCAHQPMEGGDNGLSITLVPEVFSITFSCSLAQQHWGLLLIFDWLVH